MKSTSNAVVTETRDPQLAWAIQHVNPFLEAMALARLQRDWSRITEIATFLSVGEILKLDKVLNSWKPRQRVALTSWVIGAEISPALMIARAVDLSGLRIGATSLKRIVQSKYFGTFGRVRVLILHRAAIGDEGAKVIANARSLRHLQRLILSDCGITSAGVRVMGVSRYLVNVRDLNLSKNRGIQIAAAIASAPSFSQLIRLTLCGNRIGKAGVQMISSSTSLLSLKSLVL